MLVRNKFNMVSNSQSVDSELFMNDDFLDWETRHESIPLGKHIIAGMTIFALIFYGRIMCWHR